MTAQVIHTPGRFIGLPVSADAGGNPFVAPPCMHCASRDHCLGARLGADKDMVLRHHRRLKNREHIFRQGDNPEALYIVQSGSAKLYFVGENGSEQVVAFYMPGETVGLDALCTDHYRSSALALESTSLCVIPFSGLFESTVHPHSLYQTLSRELVRDQHTIELIARKDADAKMAIFLTDLSRRFEERGYSPLRFNLSMKRSEIGSHLGLAIETISRILTRFQEDKILRVDRRQVEILDYRRLEDLAGC